MAAIINARDVLLQAAATRYVTPTLSAHIDFANVIGATKPSDNATVGAIWGTNLVNQPTSLGAINSGEGSKLSGIADGADVTSTILSSSGTSIVMSNANLFKSSTGLGGVFIGAGGIVGKNTSGVTTFSVDGSTGAASFSGNITGGANIDINGTAKFSGLTTVSGQGWTVSVNDVFNVRGGLYSYGTIGLLGSTTTGTGVWASATGAGIAMKADANGAGGIAMQVLGGNMTIDNSTLVSNLNAQYLNGNASSAFAAAGHNHDSTYLGINAQATDSAQLGGFGTGSWVRQTGVTAGGPGAATHTLTIVTGGITARIGIVYP